MQQDLGFATVFGLYGKSFRIYNKKNLTRIKPREAILIGIIGLSIFFSGFCSAKIISTQQFEKENQIILENRRH